MKKLILALALATLAACASYDGYNLRPGAAEADVVATMGPPAMQFPNTDGTHALAYPRGPLGLQTFMVDVGADGRMIAIRQVLNDETFNRIRPGMTRDDVLRMIGPPGDSMDFPRMQQESWEWRYQDTWRYIAIFSVNLDRGGIVVSKFTKRIDRSDGRK